MNDMGRIDPMYQFSLDAYIELFSNSIDKSLKHPRLEERIQYLNDFHTFAVYQYTCRGLFERHKLLFSFQMCAKILEAGGKLNLDEYNFFLRGGIVSPLKGWVKFSEIPSPFSIWGDYYYLGQELSSLSICRSWTERHKWTTLASG